MELTIGPVVSLYRYVAPPELVIIRNCIYADMSLLRSLFVTVFMQIFRSSGASGGLYLSLYGI